MSSSNNSSSLPVSQVIQQLTSRIRTANANLGRQKWPAQLYYHRHMVKDTTVHFSCSICHFTIRPGPANRGEAGFDTLCRQNMREHIRNEHIQSKLYKTVAITDDSVYQDGSTRPYSSLTEILHETVSDCAVTSGILPSIKSANIQYIVYLYFAQIYGQRNQEKINKYICGICNGCIDSTSAHEMIRHMKRFHICVSETIIFDTNSILNDATLMTTK